MTRQPTPRAGRTREKILAATTRVMNEHGCNAGTVQIAESCGISPGNLYYYFANREEILREIFTRLEADLEAVLRTGDHEDIDASRLAGFYTGGAGVLWRYRFLFSSATEFIARDPWLASEYRSFSARSIRQMERIIGRVIGLHGNDVQADTARIRAIAENKWVLWIAWPRYAEMGAGANGLRPGEFARGLEQIFSLLAPYITDAFGRATGAEVHRFVEEQTLDDLV